LNDTEFKLVGVPRLGENPPDDSTTTLLGTGLASEVAERARTTAESKDVANMMICILQVCRANKQASLIRRAWVNESRITWVKKSRGNGT